MSGFFFSPLQKNSKARNHKHMHLSEIKESEPKSPGMACSLVAQQEAQDVGFVPMETKRWCSGQRTVPPVSLLQPSAVTGASVAVHAEKV